MKGPHKHLTLATREEWRAWLEKHYATEQAVWLLHYKKKAARRSLTLEEAVEEALCFGWIDGVLRSIDKDRYVLRYSPRTPKSIWSEINKRRAMKLIRQGRMTAAGLDKIAQAKASGEWDAASTREDVSAIPLDLARALRKKKTVWAAFQRWPPSRKKQYLFWLSSAKTVATRQKRIHAIAEMAAVNSLGRRRDGQADRCHKPGMAPPNPRSQRSRLRRDVLAALSRRRLNWRPFGSVIAAPLKRIR